MIFSSRSGTCLSEFSPDGDVSCCQLSADGQVVVYGLKNSMNLHTLVLCHELGAAQEASYGNPGKDGCDFQMGADWWPDDQNSTGQRPPFSPMIVLETKNPFWNVFCTYGVLSEFLLDVILRPSALALVLLANSCSAKSLWKWDSMYTQMWFGNWLRPCPDKWLEWTCERKSTRGTRKNLIRSRPTTSSEHETWISKLNS